jgi:2,4-dienoyl-CoA reductase (NADPH2)
MSVDAIIIATGAVPDMEAYAGSDKKIVCNAFDILLGKVIPGKNTVLLGGKALSIAVALYIINKYKDVNVSIVGPQKKFGPDVNISYVWRYMLKMKQGGVQQLNRTNAKEIVDDGVVIIDAEKKEVKLPADTVVVADLRPNTEVKYGKYGNAEVFMIGDAIQVRRGYAAIHDGYRMGMKFSHQWYRLMHRTVK